MMSQLTTPHCRTDMYVRITIPASVYQSNFSAKRISFHSYQSIRIFLQSGATYFCSITILAKHDRPTRATEAFRGSLPPSRASTHKPEETGLIKNMLSALTSKSKRTSKNISEFPSRGGAAIEMAKQSAKLQRAVMERSKNAFA